MQVGDPTVIIPPIVVPPVVSPAGPQVRPAGGGRATGDDSNAPADQRRAEFRAALDAAAGENSGTYAPPLSAGTGVSAQQAPPEKLPSGGDIEIDGAEASELYSAAHGSNADTPTEETTFEPPRAPTHQFRTATQQYAQNYFRLGGTFASRGDSLEVRA